MRLLEKSLQKASEYSWALPPSVQCPGLGVGPWPLRRALPSVWGLALCAESLPDAAEPRPPVEPRPLRQAVAPVLSPAPRTEPRPLLRATPFARSHASSSDPRPLRRAWSSARSPASLGGVPPPPWSPLPAPGPTPFAEPRPPPPQQERGVPGCRAGYSQGLASLLRARSVATWGGGGGPGPRRGPVAKRGKRKGSGSNGLAHTSTGTRKLGLHSPWQIKSQRMLQKCLRTTLLALHCCWQALRRIRKDKPRTMKR